MKKSGCRGFFFFHIYHHYVITTLLTDNFGLYLMLDWYNLLSHMRVIIWRLGPFVYIGGGGEGIIQETESLNFRSLEPRSWHLCRGPVI